jgi:hypothetical protein
MIQGSRRGWSVVAGAVAVAGCSRPQDELACEHAVCPITEPSCVERVAEVVGCKLGLEILHPEVRFLTATQVLAEMQDTEAPPTAEEARAYADGLRAEALVGLMPEGYAAEDADADWVNNVAAYYSPDTKGIVVVKDHMSDDPQDEYALLVHEMVHAYQDAAWGLQVLQDEHAPTYDRWLGVRALIEGDAVLYQSLAYVELAGYEPQEIDWGGYFGEWQDDSLKRAAETDTPSLDVQFLFPYAFGGDLLMEAWFDGGEERIEELSQRPPDSARQVLGGFAAWPGLLTNEDAAFDPQAVAVMPANYELLSGAHEGVWLLNATMQRTAAGGLQAPELSSVSADYVAAWRWNDSEVVAMWRIRSGRRHDLIAALTRPGALWAEPGDVPLTHLVTTIDADVLLIAVSGGDARTVLADIAGWQSPEDAFMVGEAGGLRPVRPGLLGCAGRRG